MKTIDENDSNYICDINAPCFMMLSPEEVEAVRTSKTQVLFRKGDNLTKQGAFASYVLFIIDGLAKQYIEGDGNKSFNLRIIRMGEFVGLASVFSRNTFDYSSVALTDCRAFLVEKSAIISLIKHNGAFGFNIIKKYCEQNSNLFDTLNVANFKHMNGRMAETLLYINTVKQEYPEIFQLLTRKDIADFAGASTESAVKLLKTFEKEGLINLNEKDIEIKKTDDLVEISKHG